MAMRQNKDNPVSARAQGALSTAGFAFKVPGSAYTISSKEWRKGPHAYYLNRNVIEMRNLKTG